MYTCEGRDEACSLAFSLIGIIRLPTLSLTGYYLPILWSRPIMFTAALLFHLQKACACISQHTAGTCTGDQ